MFLKMIIFWREKLVKSHNHSYIIYQTHFIDLSSVNTEYPDCSFASSG